MDVVQAWVSFAADAARAKQNGARLERFNLARQPLAFAENPPVSAFLERSGLAALMRMDGEVGSVDRYPNCAERARRPRSPPSTRRRPQGVAAPAAAAAEHW